MGSSIILLVLLISSSSAAVSLPFIVLHGIGDECSNKGITKFTQQLSLLSSCEGFCIEIGDGAWDSWFMPLLQQTQIVCDKVKNMKQLSNGFNIVGLSQGNLIGRGVIQFCDGSPQVKNLISLGGPHAGTASVPLCGSGIFCKIADALIKSEIYTDYIQEHLAPSGYLKLPNNIDAYLQHCKFLPKLNNEIPQQRNSTYKDRFSSLHNLVLIMFEQDTVLIPKETAWFGYYPSGEFTPVLAPQQTRLYGEDWIGLKTLDEAGRVKYINVSGNHLGISENDIKKHVIPYLIENQELGDDSKLESALALALALEEGRYYSWPPSIISFFSNLLDLNITPTWGKELLQLVFVGIAVSYGLFSTKRNHVSPPPTPPPPHHKQDDAQSYVLFESSSLFDHDHDHDDDFEIPSASLSSHETSSKVWNSQYYRGEPIVVVANKESSSSVVTDEDGIVGGRQENNIGVLRSPVPWRSRSGRNMEVNTPAAAASPSNPPAPSVSEIRSKSFQDFGRSSRKKTTIPPPPPPPPPPLPLNRNNRKEFTRNYNNRSSRRGTALSKPNQTQQQENYLSHDHEIESFIETRGGGKFIIPNPKQEEEEEDNKKKKKKKEITDTESEYDDDDDLASKTSNANGPDVDKKADEFIAKFREQIRLQRIASIRTSTQIHKNNIY